MITFNKYRQMILVAVANLGLTASLCGEPRVTSGVPRDETHQQATPPTGIKNTLPVEIGSEATYKTPSPDLTNQDVTVKSPQVSYDDGQLTIVAENVPLSSVLDALRRVMGANIEMPPGAADKMIWIRSGPGPARRVLRDLLDGTELDYVIQASETDVDGVRSIFLTPRSKGTDTGELGSSPVRGPNRRAQSASIPLAESSEMDTAAEDTVASSSESTPAEPAVPTSPQPPPHNQTPSVASTATIATLPVGNSEHTTQHLQDLYQQRRQLQMQQNQKLPTAN